jgi:hypothetical protein
VNASVFYYQRAEIECGDPGARKADLENAAYWEDLAIKVGTKKETLPNNEMARAW